MLASTCMSLRFCAITNSSGDCRLAATVWPFSMARLITMPSTGEVMRVRCKSTRACASAASRWATLAWAVLIWASVTPACACASLSDSVVVLTSARALSASLWAMNCFSTRLCLRSKSRWASFRSTCARATWARLAERVGLRRQHRSPRGIDIGLGRAHAVLEGLRVDLRDQLAGLDSELKST
jgi:hypothetical protein